MIVEKNTKELSEANNTLKKINRVFIGREKRIIELKQKVNELSTELGRTPPYSNPEITDDML